MTDATPRMYYLFPELAGNAAMLEPHLARCAAMGFRQILVPAPARQAGDTAANAGAPASAPADAALATLVRACAANGLALIIDFDPGAAAVRATEPVPAGQAGDVRPDTLPDPRGRAGAPSPAMDDSAPGSADETYWIETLQGWSNAGAAGFCCRSLAHRAPGFWQRLMGALRAAAPATQFFAWTPGATPAQLATLVGCGFDATFASTAWWDYHADWLAEEATRLAAVAPAVAIVDDPFDPVLARDRLHGDDDAVRRQYLRVLATAAATGAGILLPMGFEYGLAGMRDGPTTVSLDAGAPGQIDLSAAVTAANALVAHLGQATGVVGAPSFTTLSAVPGGTTALLRRVSGSNAAAEAVMVLINSDARATASADLARLVSRTDGMLARERLWPDDGIRLAEGERHVLQPAEVQVFALYRPPVVVTAAVRGKRTLDAACKAPRIAIEAITPAVDGGRFPVKRTVGETIDIEADVFMDGHDKLGVALLWRTADSSAWQELPMPFLVNDRWRAALPLRRVGRYQYVVQAWRDAFATYRDELSKKSAAGLDVTLELEEGRRLIDAAATHAASRDLAHAAIALATLSELLASKPEASGDPDPATHRARLVAAVLAAETGQAMRQADNRPFAVLSAPVSLDAERTAARFSSWYELFPRSQSGDADRHGTFADVERRLPAIRAMGFDTLYFPPIHPIGKTNRKGRNNSLTPTPDDPGSPYAIGSPEGGHDAIHSELGTLEDFRHLCRAARAHGLEIALDFAIQCSPDHPWIKDHPDWFAWRPDGTMRYAENPPKRYEDIVNVDFYAEGAVPALWLALRNVVLFWVNEGVRVFRVDNPHTKPLPFWEWMIGDIRGRFPDTIFLSEAFTRPKVMYRLAKVGFSQSYTYFTWRHTKAEFTDYLTELSTTAVRDFFRPHFFVNTPDINPGFLQKSGRPGFLIRAALATTLSGLWGMYSGFELCEATPVPDKEDYLNSEKYEVRAWNWQRPGNIIAEITALNHIRRAHPALQSHLGIQFCDASDPNVLCFIKSTPPAPGSDGLGDDVVFVAINLDPFAAHQTSVTLPLWQFGLPHDGRLAVRDLLHGNRFTLQGAHHELRLDPLALPYAVWHLQLPEAQR